MSDSYQSIKSKLADKGLKVTPQRVAILDALLSLNNHPTADQVALFVRKNNPGIATGTIYHVLDTFVEHGIIKRVKTDEGYKRFDPMLTPHHHIYCSATDKIADYEDAELDRMIREHFRKKGIDGFEIDEVKLQINGKFIQKGKSNTKS